MNKPLLLVGGGGHCKACIDVIEEEGSYVIEGIIDQKEKIGTYVLQYPVIADDTRIADYIAQGFSFLITVGQIKSVQLRKTLYDTLIENKASIATIISSRAVVSKYARIGRGTIVMHQAVVNADASVGENVILNTGCLIEHDAVVANHVHISTQAVINGGAFVNEGSFIGSNAVMVQETKVGSNVIIGAGSVVVSDIENPGTYVGNPAKKITN